MEVSVIVPAHNAASTLAETLESLLAQTFVRWEAIVVNDGSHDATPSIATGFAASDPRIRVVSQLQKGESGARNTGLAQARFDWLLFLDADDWLLPEHLERLTDTLALDQKLDGAICGWTRIAPDGSISAAKHCPQPDNIFELSARYCPFAIHACVIRRSLVEAVGGFDQTLRTCPDWDLWQRIARVGARFRAIPDVLALYRMRPDSAGINGPQVLNDALRVITRGHSPDPRLTHLACTHANGVPEIFLSKSKLQFACWAAGLVIGSGDEASWLLDTLGNARASQLDPDEVAWTLFESVLLPTCRTTDQWVEIWPSQEERINDFLQALEAQSLAPGLAARSRSHLTRLAIEHATTPRPFTLGRTHAVRIEITDPLPDICAPATAERLLGAVELEGKLLGTLELPVCDGLVPAYVLADAIAAQFAWLILGRFFERTLYPHFTIKRGANGVSVWRGALRMARGLSEGEAGLWSRAHDRIGWTVFLQELWAMPTWPASRFYSSWASQRAVPEQRPKADWYIAEVSEDLADVEVVGPKLHFVPTIGGTPLGVISIPAPRKVVRGRQLRLALLAEIGFELARAVVREAILGQPLHGPPASLRERLQLAAAGNPGQPGTGIPLSEEEYSDIGLHSRVSELLRQALPPDKSRIVLGARTSEAIGTSASRRAMLPAEAAPELLDAAAATGENVICISENGKPPGRIAYAPDLINCAVRLSELPARSANLRRGPQKRPTLHHLQNRLLEFSPVLHPFLRNVTRRLPILMYHRVAPEGDEKLAHYRVTPEAFEEQLRYLREAHYYSVSLEEWDLAMRNERPLAGRGVLLTFDDGYLDFLTFAWPLLQYYGFAATVFLVAGEIGGTSRWDRARGEEVPLLGWEDIRYLQKEGVEFGSHSFSHRPLSALSPLEIVREGSRSRAILMRELGRVPKALAYPHGDEDLIVRHLIGACGYVFGLSCQFGLSGFYDSLLALPRIEVTGSDTLPEFKKKLGGVEA